MTSVNFKVIGLTRWGFEPTRFGFPDLSKWETDGLLIQPSHLVKCFRYIHSEHFYVYSEKFGCIPLANCDTNKEDCLLDNHNTNTNWMCWWIKFVTENIRGRQYLSHCAWASCKWHVPLARRKRLIIPFPVPVCNSTCLRWRLWLANLGHGWTIFHSMCDLFLSHLTISLMTGTRRDGQMSWASAPPPLVIQTSQILTLVESNQRL